MSFRKTLTRKSYRDRRDEPTKMKDPSSFLSLLLALSLLRNTSVAFRPCARQLRTQQVARETSIEQTRIATTPWSIPDPQRTLLLRAQDDLASNGDLEKIQAIDRILSIMTTAFPLFVTGAAVIGFVQPAALNWVNQYTTAMLAAVMWGTGLTLQPSDFAEVWKSFPLAVPVGVVCQFAIMPLAAWSVGQCLSGFEPTLHSALYIGLCLVGCSPGGTASNLVSLIAGANVALSVLLTTCSTFLAVVMTPLLVKTLLVSSNLPKVQVSGLALCVATAKVVLLPVFGGMFFHSKAPKLAKAVSRWTPFGSVALVSLICGGVVAQTAPLLRSSSEIWSRVLGSVVALHTIGFTVGYLVPRCMFRDRQVARTVSIEVGMQNSALAVVLARSIGSHPAASLPGALSATVHSCMGSFLAAIWRLQPSPMKNESTVTSE